VSIGELPKKIDELRKVVERIERILKYDAGTERDRPRLYARNVDNLSISGDYGSRPDSDSVKAANAVKEAAINVERLRGEKERDAGLRTLAGELESLRAILCNLAAAACIEIGVAARAMNEEADR
jgi:hypothetical protein